MTHPYEGMNREISDLAREIAATQGYTWPDALLDARLLVDDLHEFARRWDEAQAHERAVVEGWGSAFEQHEQDSAAAKLDSMVRYGWVHDDNSDMSV